MMVALAIMGIICRVITGCHTENKPPVDTLFVLQTMISAVEKIPTGQCRSSSSDEGTKEFLSPDLLAGLYGEASRKWIHDTDDAILDSAAVYLSEQRHPFELAVFRCKNEGDISGGQGSVMGICQSRLASVARAWQGSEYESVVTHAIVIHEKQFVILIVAEDPAPIITAAKKAIG